MFGEQNVHQGSSEIISIIRIYQPLCTASMHHMGAFEHGPDTTDTLII